jgi:type VI protein secretion system component VasK
LPLSLLLVPYYSVKSSIIALAAQYFWRVVWTTVNVRYFTALSIKLGYYRGHSTLRRNPMAEYSDRRPSTVAWIALVAAIIALIIGWAAYNRSGEDLEDSAADAVNETTQQVEEGAEEAGEATQDATDAAEDAADTGPDGVDDGAE